MRPAEGSGIFGHVVNYFAEPENHKRGSYHAHTVSRIYTAASTEEEKIAFWKDKIVAMIPGHRQNEPGAPPANVDPRLQASYMNTEDDLDNHPSAKRYDLNSSPIATAQDLRALVISNNFHKSCSEYCLVKNPHGGSRTCRLNAPWDLNPQACYKDNVKAKTRDFHPQRNHERISPYSPWCSLLWRANNDAQVISSYYAATKYITKYITMGDFDSKVLHAIMAKAIGRVDDGPLLDRDKRLKKLVKLMNSLSNERETSLHESIANILRINLRLCTMTIRDLYVTTQVPTVELQMTTGARGHLASTVIPSSEAWIDYPFRHLDLINLSLWTVMQSFEKRTARNHERSGSRRTLFEFRDEHPEQATAGYVEMSRSRFRYLILLPYNRFSETSIPWRKQMILDFRPWSFTNANDHSRIVFNDASTLPLERPTDEQINQAYNVLANAPPVNFDRFLTQYRTMERNKQDRIRAFNEAGEEPNSSDYTLADSANDTADEPEENLREDNELIRLTNPESVERLASSMDAIPDKQRDEVNHLVGIARTNELFALDPPDQATLPDDYIGTREMSPQEMEPLSSWIKDNETAQTNATNEPDLARHTLARLIPLLTTEQRRAFGLFKTYVDAYIHFKLTVNDRPEPLHLLVTGPAGAGKSMVLNVFREYLRYKDLSSRLVVAAYAGMAAMNVQGELLCRRFKIPVAVGAGKAHHKLSQKNARHLSASALADLARTTAEIDFLFIGEYSQLTPLTVNDLHVNMNDLKGGGFCGLQTCTVWFGDHSQLGPVSGYSLTTRPDYNKLTDGDKAGIAHWHLNVQKVVVLTQVHRQSNSEHQALLEGIRLGNITAEQHQFLEGRVDGSTSVLDLKPYRDALFLFGPNIVVAEFNRLMQIRMANQNALLSKNAHGYGLHHFLARDQCTQAPGAL